MTSMTDFRADEDTTLGNLGAPGESMGEPIKVLIGQNMGHVTLNTTLAMHKFWEMSEVANERNLAIMGEDISTFAQRKLDVVHARGLARYMLKGLVTWAKLKFTREGHQLSADHEQLLIDLGEQPYQAIQAITANIRNCEMGGRDLRVRKTDGDSTLVYLNQAHILWVVDGQHRREAMNMVFEFLKSVLTTKRYAKKGLFIPSHLDLQVRPGEAIVWSAALEGAKTACTVDVQIHLGLSPDEERQLFHDLNNLTKKVEKSIANKFDAANPINQFIKKVLEEQGVLTAKIVDQDTSHVWKKNDGSLSRKDVVTACALFFGGETDAKKVMASSVNQDIELGERFWRALSNLPAFGKSGSNQKTILAQAVVIKALAQLAYTFRESREADPHHFERFISALENHKIDFSHKNAMWHIFEVPAEERDVLCPGISQAITPPEAGFNLTIGDWDANEQVMRFSANSRDVQRHLGDIIRWHLNLPKRPALQKVFEGLSMA